VLWLVLGGYGLKSWKESRRKGFEGISPFRGRREIGAADLARGWCGCAAVLVHGVVGLTGYDVHPTRVVGGCRSGPVVLGIGDTAALC